MLIDVEVNFNGFVTVNVPNHLSESDKKLLAQKIALSRILATTDNPDAPDEDAFDEYKEDCSSKLTAENDWDNTTLEVNGNWYLT